MPKSPLARMLIYGAIATAILLPISLSIDWFPKQASKSAHQIDTLYDVLLIVSVPIFVLVDFLYGIGLLWLYAAIRPRYGAGPKTAVIAGLALWVYIGLLHAIAEAPMGMMPQRVTTIGTIVALIALPVAGAVGASIYKEV